MQFGKHTAEAVNSEGAGLFRFDNGWALSVAYISQSAVDKAVAEFGHNPYSDSDVDAWEVATLDPATGMPQGLLEILSGQPQHNPLGFTLRGGLTGPEVEALLSTLAAAGAQGAA